MASNLFISNFSLKLYLHSSVSIRRRPGFAFTAAYMACVSGAFG